VPNDDDDDDDDDYDDNSGNVSCVPVRYLKNIKTEIYRTIILPLTPK